MKKIFSKTQDLKDQNLSLAKTVTRQGEYIFKQEKIINNYSNKLVNILSIIQSNNYNDYKTQVSRIRNEILK